MDLVIGTRNNPTAADRLIGELRGIKLTEATLYIGYPILPTADHSISVDAILTCVEHGIVLFDLATGEAQVDWDAVEEWQGEAEIALKSKLIRHKDLTANRDLAVPIHTVTYLPAEPASPPSDAAII